MIRALFDWFTGTLAFYAVGMGAYWFVIGEAWLPLTTPGDRLFLLVCGLGAAGMMVEDGKARRAPTAPKENDDE